RDHGAAGGGGHLRRDACTLEVDGGAVGAVGGDTSGCGHRKLLGKGPGTGRDGTGRDGTGRMQRSMWGKASADAQRRPSPHGALLTRAFGLVDAKSEPMF